MWILERLNKLVRDVVVSVNHITFFSVDMIKMIVNKNEYSKRGSSSSFSSSSSMS